MGQIIFGALKQPLQNLKKKNSFLSYFCIQGPRNVLVHDLVTFYTANTLPSFLNYTYTKHHQVLSAIYLRGHLRRLRCGRQLKWRVSVSERLPLNLLTLIIIMIQKDNYNHYHALNCIPKISITTYAGTWPSRGEMFFLCGQKLDIWWFYFSYFKSSSSLSLSALPPPPPWSVFPLFLFHD